MLRILLVAKVLEGIRPEEIAHRPERRRLFEPVQLKQQVNRISPRIKLTAQWIVRAVARKHAVIFGVIVRAIVDFSEFAVVWSVGLRFDRSSIRWLNRLCCA